MANNETSDYIEGAHAHLHPGSRGPGEVRFAVVPATEAILSLRALRDPARFPLQPPWVRLVQNRLAGLDWEVLGCLMNDRMGSSDFLTPPMSGPLTTYAADLGPTGAAP
jgi:hypothetical protein